MADADHVVLLAGGIALAGGFAKEGHWPDKGVEAVIGTLGLTLLASATQNSRIGPIVRAFAWLLLLVAVYSVVPALHHTVKQTVKPKPKPKGK